MASQNAGGSNNIDIQVLDRPLTELPLTEFQLKKYLLLLATLVATVTYVAGLNLPGASWLEDTGGQVAGESILRETNYYRYIVFYYCNATSFAASLVVSLILLLPQEKADQRSLRAVMVVDLFGLMGAYAAGSSRDSFTTICASVMVFGLFAYVTVAFLQYTVSGSGSRYVWHPDQEKAPAEHEILMVLAIFAATIAYVAGMNPPGGFWRSTQEGHHTGGDPILQGGGHSVRYKAFFFCNTTALVASLLAIMLIVDYKKLNICGSEERLRRYGIYGSVVTALFGLGGAYAAGSCRDPRCTAYVLSPVVAGVAYYSLQVPLTKATMGIAKAIKLPEITGAIIGLPCIGGICKRVTKRLNCAIWRVDRQRDDRLDKAREFIQLLAILAATITYQAGLDPPGGLWPDNGEGHPIGDSILLTTHPGRYKVFFYFNSAAFVASLVIIVMLQNEYLVRLHVLEAAMILDLFSLVGAYAAGSCRDTSTSIYVVAIAGAVLIYVVIHIVFSTVDHGCMDDDKEMDKYREVLLLLAILAATLTYQAGLTPPGGFWEMDDKHGPHHAGFSVLQDEFPRRYKAFFYCNAASFMASVALIILLVNPNLYKPGIRCNALFVCMVGGMFGLMAAYAAGSSLHLKASIFVLVLVALVFLYTGYAYYYRYRPEPNPHVEEEQNQQHQQQQQQANYNMAKYLMLLGILAASVTYLTGLKPPGGLWRDDNNGHSAGSPILYDMDRHRHYIFFYFNSTSFMASIVVIALLLLQRNVGLRPPWPMHTAMLLDMLALLGAYAAGSARDWDTSRNVILLLFPVVAFLGLLFLCKKKDGSVDIPIQAS